MMRRWVQINISQSIKSRLQQGYPWLLLAGAVSSLTVFSARFLSVLDVSGFEPTSGLEGAGAFGIYRVCTNQSVYHDFSKLPNGFIYNFLFYDIYGYLIRFLSYCDATALIGRLITVSLLVAAAGLVWIASRPALERVEASVVAFALFSPAIGWWAFALRPDVGGVTFLMAALLCFVYYLSYPRLWIALLSGGCLVCAWGFKQPYVFAAPVMLGYTVSRNRIHAAVLLLVLVVGFCVPLLIFDWRLYLVHTVKIASIHPIDPALALKNVVSFGWKGLSVLIPAALIGWITLRREQLCSGINSSS